MKLTLYSFWRSSCSWRVRIALTHKGLAYTYVPVHLVRDGGEQNTERYRALNPTRTVPLLVVEEGGEPQRYSQSMAIIEYLDERVPTPALLPATAALRARARIIAETVNSGIQPLQNTSVLGYVRDRLGGDQKAWVRHWIDRGLTALEDIVGETAGRHCIGDSVTIADLYLVPQMHHARRFGLDTNNYPRLARIERACEPLPAFQQAHPQAQPDAEKA